MREIDLQASPCFPFPSSPSTPSPVPRFQDVKTKRMSSTVYSSLPTDEKPTAFEDDTPSDRLSERRDRLLSRKTTLSVAGLALLLALPLGYLLSCQVGGSGKQLGGPIPYPGPPNCATGASIPTNAPKSVLLAISSSSCKRLTRPDLRFKQEERLGQPRNRSSRRDPTVVERSCTGTQPYAERRGAGQVRLFVHLLFASPALIED